MPAALSIALIGFGEVGATLADDLAGRAEVSAWDLKFTDAGSASLRDASRRSLRAATSAADAVSGAGIVISAVTAAQTVSAASSCIKGIARDATFLDLNSASPGAKTEAARVINESGGRYVEAAVMSPIAPKRIASPILFGGPHAEAFLPVAHGLGFAGASMFSSEYGVAAAAKLCRSIMVKGIEALLTESMLAARHYRVEDTVLASLNDLFPGLHWQDLAQYMIARALQHGVRRGEEMREAARTVEEAGLAPLLSEAIAARQDWAATFAAALSQQELAGMLDAIRAEMNARNEAAS